jgi:cytochrome c553
LIKGASLTLLNIKAGNQGEFAMPFILNNAAFRTRMRAPVLFAALVCASGLMAGNIALGGEAPPTWAYPVSPPGPKPPPDDGIPRRVPDSEATFTVTQTRDPFFSPDWHPNDHPPMPEIVSNGRKPGVLACGFCHRADGSGGPENARIAGLPAAYIAQQMADFVSGARKTSVPERLAPKYMIITAKGMNNQEMEASSRYFAAIKPRSAVRVVEAETVPTTTVEGERLAVTTEAGTEPIGKRIIEVPVDPENFVLRDGHAHFVAYVPPGSIQKGGALVAAGIGGAGSCVMCHGDDLRGLGPIPGIAGRSPSYIVRQLYDFQTGVRAGAWSPLMKPVVEKLTLDEMISLAAYAASLSP